MILILSVEKEDNVAQTKNELRRVKVKKLMVNAMSRQHPIRIEEQTSSPKNKNNQAKSLPITEWHFQSNLIMR